jgi:hypothetical protein
MHEYWIITLACGVVCSIIVYGRGRSRVGWLLAGMPAGPLGTVMAPLAPISRAGAYSKLLPPGGAVSGGAAARRCCYPSAGRM